MFLDIIANAVTYGSLPARGGGLVRDAALVARFAARVRALGPLTQAAPALQERLLDEVRAVARRLDTSRETGSASGFERRVLYEERGRWSLAAIILRPGQQIDPHDHSGWGCAVTVRGVERERRFTSAADGRLALLGERDYPAGTGYLFDSAAVHQPVGADPRQVTVALHFLVQEG